MLGEVLQGLMSLPSPFRPTEFGEDESDLKSRHLVADEKAFRAFCKGRVAGFFLFSPITTILINAVPGRSLRVHCSAPTNAADLLENMLAYLAPRQPIFGFACEQEERFFRNRVITQLGLNTVESWVGRDSSRYLPGLYWLTLLSAVIIKMHDIDLDMLKRTSIAYTEAAPGQHLFRFYQEPGFWHDAPQIADLYSATPGIFDA